MAMNLTANIVDISGELVTFMLEEKDSNREIVRNYTKGDEGQLRQVIESSQKYFLYLEHGNRVAEEYNARKHEMQRELESVVAQLEKNEA